MGPIYFVSKGFCLHAAANLPFLFPCVAYSLSKFTVILIRFQWNMLYYHIYDDYCGRTE